VALEEGAVLDSKVGPAACKMGLEAWLAQIGSQAPQCLATWTQWVPKTRNRCVAIN